MNRLNAAIPGFVLMEEIGRGAQGIVYRANRSGVHCAVKIPYQTFQEGSNDSWKRFYREAVLLARVRHPSLPRILEVGRTEEVPYLVRELVVGDTLTSHLQKGPLSWRELLPLATQLSSALARIHELGLVHGDIRPDNVLLNSITQQAYLIDFGLASSKTVSTSTGRSDDAFDFARNRDPRNDIVAFGRVLFQCATGATPWSVTDPRPSLARTSRSFSGNPDVVRKFVEAVETMLGFGVSSNGATALRIAYTFAELEASAGARGDLRVQEGHNVFGTTALPCCGRERQLQQLRAARRTALAGSGHVALVVGPPGSGKTRILQAFHTELAREGQSSIVATCVRFDHEPFGTIRRIVDAWLDNAETRDEVGKHEAEERLRTLAKEAGAFLQFISPRVREVLQSDPAQVREWSSRTATVPAEALADLVGKLLNEPSPSVLIVDDIQWMDTGSRSVIGRLADDKASKVLCVFGARSTEMNSTGVRRLLNSVRTDILWEVSIGTLNAESIEQMVRAYLTTDHVDPELLRFVSSTSDGTPLSVLELLRTMLDECALTLLWGRWTLDRAAVAKLSLPRGSTELFAQRVAELSAETRQVLCVAAIADVFDARLLSHVCDVEKSEVEQHVVHAVRAMLVELGEDGGYRFVHDSVRSVLRANLEDSEIKRLHTKVAVAYDEWAAGSRHLDVLRLSKSPPSSRFLPSALVCAAALHYSLGEISLAPERAAVRCEEAGTWAYQGHDEDLALRFLRAAHQMYVDRRKDPPASLRLLLAEVMIRVGELTGATRVLREVVIQETDVVEKAHVLSRISWAETRIDRERAWEPLREAFEVIGLKMPQGTPGAVVSAAFRASAEWWLSSRTSRHPELERRIGVVASLCLQAARLAYHTNRPLMMIEATLRSLAPVRRSKDKELLARVYAYSSLLATAGGLRNWGVDLLEKSMTAAVSSGNPAVEGDVYQHRYVVAAWGGNMRDSLRSAELATTKYGASRELPEFCLLAVGQQQIDSLRGRNFQAWEWMDPAVKKVTKHEGPQTASEVFEAGVRAALTALGREREADVVLTRVANVMFVPQEKGELMVPNYGSRVRQFTESGQFGEGLEAVVRDVEAQNYNPRRVLLEVTEYYVHLAHARVHAVLRASDEEREEALRKLEPALRDVKKAARIPLLKAHALAVEGYSLFFAGKLKKAERVFAKAEALGVEEGAPWILYAVHRGRAHMAKARGLMDTAQDQARIAEALAKEHGAAYRVRWIREEFDLPGSSFSDGSLSPSAYSGSWVSQGPPSQRRVRRYLKSLVRIDQQDDLSMRQQACSVLDELLESVGADRGLLFLSVDWVRAEPQVELGEVTSGALLERPGAQLQVVAARNSAGDVPLEQQAFDEGLVEELYRFGVPDSPEEQASGVVRTVQSERAVIALPFAVREERIGVVYLDRPRRVPFTEDDTLVLAPLAVQVPLVFELGRSLRARGRAEQTQRSAEKLEAVARLAGGIAHDFNNMLTVILTAAESIRARQGTEKASRDVEAIHSSAERARELTQQLLLFSRGEYINPEAVSLNAHVERLQPIFERLLGPSIQLEVRLEPHLCEVQADGAQIDQVLTNLVVNAGDAMPGGGRLRIETESVELSDTVDTPRKLRSGQYARVTVSDTGVGMDEETVKRAFEPFFTTKGDRSGTGLGLATAYGIITQNGGHIDVQSRVGKGTTFRILLPAVESARFDTRRAPPISAAVPKLRNTSEVVDHLVSEPVLHDATSDPMLEAENGATENTLVEYEPAGHDNDALTSYHATILLIDDDAMVRQSLRRKLISMGHTVLTAESADDALDMAQENLARIDLVLTDVLMPDMNGLELAKELSRISPTAEVLFMSGYTDGVLEEKGILQPGIPYLQKPIQNEALNQRIEEALRRRATDKKARPA